MKSQFKPWLVLGVIFVLGILTGSALTIGLEAHFMHPPGAAQIGHNWMARLTQRLNLTPDQQAKIEPIVADASTKLQALHRNEMEQGSQIFKAAHDQISALLTPEQKAELQKMEIEREKMFSGHLHPKGFFPGDMHYHEGPGPGGPPPPPPPPPDGATNAPPPPPASGT
ncbi:MAG: hypothetical protein LV480_13680 [Methylacidiphilales bacterium]|nr:hypothetical protein [Candidatus Methylacidiphilales bacterium]